MEDIDGPLVAKEFYEQLFNTPSEFLEPDAVAYAFDAAIRTLRDTRPSPGRWAPYIHLGM
jgi:hypothetical protein